jgi:hypothetical protein
VTHRCGNSRLQIVRSTRNLELVVAASTRCVIEMDEVIAERLPRREGERRLFVAANLERQRTAGGFEMALQARLELTVAIERRRVGYGTPARIEIVRLDGVDVRLSRAVAPLAIDTFGRGSA